jgi:hypothetical protein
VTARGEYAPTTLASNGAMIRNPLPIIEESGVSVACQETLLVKRGWNINSNTLAAITTSIMFSIPSPLFIVFSLKRNATGLFQPQ